MAEEENDDIEDEELQNNLNEYYYLCPHCGAIVRDNKRNNLPCQCGREDYIKIVKAKKLSSGARCGNCHRGNYKRFYLGNDAATSVLATSLYEELPELIYEENDTPENKTTNIFSRALLSNKKKEKRTGRQFLAFSDSRQEAAKFACYLSKSYHEFLRRRGICQIIKEKKDSIISSTYTISDFVTILKAYFSSKRSFAESNNDNSNLTIISNENAWVALINELARYNSPTSLTSLGVLQFKYLGNTDEIVSIIAEEYNVSNEAVQNLLDLLFFEIVKAGAICTDNDTDINDDEREYIFYSPSQKFITKLQNPSNKKTTVTDWLPKNKMGKKGKYYKTNKLYYVTNFLHISQEDAANFLEEYFDYLIDSENKYCLIDKNKDGTYVLPAKYIQVKIAGSEGAKWYKCKKCGKISQFNMNGLCTTVRCQNEAEEIDPSKLSEENHFAKLYFSNRMSPLFIKEHTAQLNKKESAEYQEQFIKKEINALSCSTTFEMGVDVGDLETVFLRDVPPLPSNYAQRAGRAGRSVNAAAYCLTFAKLSSHDLSFFKEPEKMINGIILPPLFKVDNEKIVKRHVYAVVLSMYFSIHPEQYNHNNASIFINEKGYLELVKWINTKPSILKDMLVKSIPNIDDLHNRLGIDTFDWINDFCGNEGVFTLLINEYENNIKVYNELIEKFKRDNDLDKAYKCERKLKNYTSNKVIEFLARGNILPRYGFPVDTVELEQNTTAGNINKLRLSRDLQIAIAEYAPSSEIIADGKMYTSRYIKKANVGDNNKEWHTAYIAVCKEDNCQAVNYSLTPVTSEGVKCCSCGNVISKDEFHESINPRNGFVTEREAKPVPLSKQEKNYRTDDFYIGNIQSKRINKRKFKFNDTVVTIESTTNDSLMVKSTKSFYVCPKCGYTLAENESITGDKEANKLMKQHAHKIVTKKQHESLFGQYFCDCNELRKYFMHHVFNTDVAKISFDCDTSNYDTMISVMFAILYAISEELNIERRDIKACLSLKILNRKPKYSIIIYDAVPGGAGHSRRLVTKDGKMLYKIIKVALNNMNSCTCEPSCYNCLRSYENQKIHDKLDRKLAAKFLSSLIGKIDVLSEED